MVLCYDVSKEVIKVKKLKLGAKGNQGSQQTVVTVDNIRIGIDFALIAGPCGVESE